MKLDRPYAHPCCGTGGNERHASNCRVPNLLEWLKALIEYNDIENIRTLEGVPEIQQALVYDYIKAESDGQGAQFPRFIAKWVSDPVSTIARACRNCDHAKCTGTLQDGGLRCTIKGLSVLRTYGNDCALKDAGQTCPRFDPSELVQIEKRRGFRVEVRG